MWVIQQVGERSARVVTQVQWLCLESEASYERRETPWIIWHFFIQKPPKRKWYWLDLQHFRFSYLAAWWLTTGINEQNVKQETRTTAFKKFNSNPANSCVTLETISSLLKISLMKLFTFWIVLPIGSKRFSTSHWLSDEHSVFNVSLSHSTAATRVLCISVRSRSTAVLHRGHGCILISGILKWWKAALWIADALHHLHSTSICWSLKSCCRSAANCTHIYISCCRSLCWEFWIRNCSFLLFFPFMSKVGLLLTMVMEVICFMTTCFSVWNTVLIKFLLI